MISGGAFQPFFPFFGGGAPSGCVPRGTFRPSISTNHFFLDARYQGLRGRMSGSRTLPRVSRQTTRYVPCPVPCPPTRKAFFLHVASACVDCTYSSGAE